MANYYVTVAGAGGQTGADWANAFDISDLETFLETTVAAGDNIYVAGGTYTVSSDINTGRSGTYLLPITIIGVASGTTNEPPVPSDWADGTARPLFDVSGDSATSFTVEDYYVIRNLRVAGQRTARVFEVDDNCTVVNCYAYNSYNSATCIALYTGGACKIIDCEVVADYGVGIECSGGTNLILGCYVHDTPEGIFPNTGTVMQSCIFDTSTTVGINISGSDTISVVNCTIYNCTAGIIMATNAIMDAFINNTISNCTDGFKCNTAGTVIESAYFDYNNWYNNTRDMSWDNGSTEDNSAKGSNAVNIDPTFHDAAGGNFSLKNNSPLVNAGFSLRLGVS